MCCGYGFFRILELKEIEEDSDFSGYFFCFKIWRSRESLFVRGEKSEVEIERNGDERREF